MTDDSESERKIPAAAGFFLDAYKTLFEYQMWTYDSFHREFRLFFALELLLFGVVLKILADAETIDSQNGTILAVAIVSGIILAGMWAARQRREHHFAKARANELARLEKHLQGFAPKTFQYHSRILSNTWKRAQQERWIPIFPWIKFPNIFRGSFLRTPAFQRAFLLGWLIAGVLLALRWGGLLER